MVVSTDGSKHGWTMIPSICCGCITYLMNDYRLHLEPAERQQTWILTGSIWLSPIGCIESLCTGRLSQNCPPAVWLASRPLPSI